MSGNYNNNRTTSSMGRVPNPAHNRQIPSNIRANGVNGIYCYGCQQTKPRLAFSETQIKKASSSSPRKIHQPMCKNCTPTQPTSLKCLRCAKTLPMESFSKTQRKNQEMATCMDCRKFIEDDDSEEDYEIENDSEYYDGDIQDVL
ncbi:hypothetical protein BGZ95_003628 [Linnemannia exigua]|uniref:Stc1 domain-containing protein n=1 Tax=Linnemannia exigua TaxID=604196 RepID=A0AAD4DI55_9FUNG|nr:hypothetical protein BGZ95_003628 [Linnemannia exigua]